MIHKPLARGCLKLLVKGFKNDGAIGATKPKRIAQYRINGTLLGNFRDIV